LAFPISKNKILMRFENINDRFDDMNCESKNIKIDLYKFAKDFFLEANG